MNNEYDLVLLDVMLLEVDGFTICRELRKTRDVPIIFIIARHEMYELYVSFQKDKPAEE